jgi:hypothetical protein
MYKQLLLKSETRYYSQGTIIADSREEAKGLYVITSGQVIHHDIELQALIFSQQVWARIELMVYLFSAIYRPCNPCWYTCQVGAEIPVDSDDADTENKDDNGSTLLCVFEKG